MASRRSAASPPAPAASRRGSPPTEDVWSAWRIADGRFDPFSAVGASLVGGRWNSPGVGVIYASRSCAGAMLECLAHVGIGRVPRSHVAVEIRIAAGVAVEQHDAASLPPAWDGAALRAARAFGDAWIRDQRSAVLIVPSVAARKECKVLINPRHPDFRSIVAAAPEPVIWDARLFGAGAAHRRSKS